MQSVIHSFTCELHGQKCELRKLKKAFGRKKKNEEARVINKQFKDDAGRVYANMREILAKTEDCDRPKYEGVSVNTSEEERERFGSIEEASSFLERTVRRRGVWE